MCILCHETHENTTEASDRVVSLAAVLWMSRNGGTLCDIQRLRERLVIAPLKESQKYS